MSEVIEVDCQIRQICNENDMDRGKWRKLRMLYNSHDDMVWVTECFSSTASPGSSWIK